jgi:hypothetical protein
MSEDTGLKESNPAYGSNKEKIDPGIVQINGAYIVAKGRKVEITKLIVNLMITESIFSPFITGTVVLVDTTALAESFPLVGEELLVIDMETPGTNDSTRREYMFHLYKMENRENITMKKVQLKLHFMSIEATVDMNTKISQTFRGKISDTVKKLIKETPGLISYKKIIVEDTNNQEVHTSNFWSPVENIYYLTNRALNDKNNPGYVFFENAEGFIFASLDALNDIAPIQYFSKDQNSRKIQNTDGVKTEIPPTVPNTGQTRESLATEYGKILDMSTPVFYDYVDRLQDGMYGGSIYNYDIQTKRLNYMVRIAKDDYKKVQLQEHEAISDSLVFNPTSQLETQVIHRNLYNDSPWLPIDSGLRRMSLLKRTEILKTNIEVFGRLDYTVGRTVDLTIYSDRPLQKGDTESVDQILSGRYLITGLTHEITGDKHTCYMELCKDSVAKKIEQVTV